MTYTVSLFWFEVLGYPKLKRHKSVVHRILHTLSPCLWFEVLGYPKLKRHKAVVHRIWYILSPSRWFEVLGHPKLKRHKSVVHRIWHTLFLWWRVYVLCSLRFETLTVFSCASWMCGVPNCFGRPELKSHKSVDHRTWHTLPSWWRVLVPCPLGFGILTVPPRASWMCGVSNCLELSTHIYE